MKLVLDGRGMGATETGVGRSTRLLLESLLATAPEEAQVELLYCPPEAPLSHPRLRLWPSGVSPTAHPWTELWEATVLRSRLTRRGASLFHAPAFRTPWLGGLPRVTTIHDLAAWNVPGTIPPKFRFYLRWAVRHTLRAARVVLCPSEAVKSELQSLFPGHRARIEAVPWGAPSLPALLDGEGAARRDRLGLSGPYFLATGAGEPRKNHPAVIQALRRLPSPIPLVLTGGSLSAAELRFIDSLGMSSYIRQIGFLSPRDLCAVLQGAVALVYPSLYEGFGLPILEAMSLSVPVVTSSFGATAEVAGGAALLVDSRGAGAIDELSAAMARLLEMDGLGEELARLGRLRCSEFPWELTAQRHWRLYRQAMVE